MKVLIKRVSKDERVPYRPIALEVLGRLSPLKTNLKAAQIDEKDDEDTPPDAFTLPGSNRKKDNFIPKDTIYQNITAILNGFSIQQENSRRH